MSGVAGIGSTPLSAHHSVNVAQCREYCATVESSCPVAASRTAVSPPGKRRACGSSHSNVEPSAGRKLSW